MSWGAIAVAGVTAVMGANEANQQQKAQRQHNLAAAEHNRYSHLTGNKMNQRFGAKSVMGGALQGGLAGFQMGRSMNIGGANPGANNLNQTMGQGASTGVYQAGSDHAGGIAGGVTGYKNPYEGMNKPKTFF